MGARPSCMYLTAADRTSLGKLPLGGALELASEMDLLKSMAVVPLLPRLAFFGKKSQRGFSAGPSLGPAQVNDNAYAHEFLPFLSGPFDGGLTAV